LGCGVDKNDVLRKRFFAFLSGNKRCAISDDDLLLATIIKSQVCYAISKETFSSIDDVVMTFGDQSLDA
jgi:hypothetical protein